MIGMCFSFFHPNNSLDWLPSEASRTSGEASDSKSFHSSLVLSCVLSCLVSCIVLRARQETRSSVAFATEDKSKSKTRQDKTRARQEKTQEQECNSISLERVILINFFSDNFSRNSINAKYPGKRYTLWRQPNWRNLMLNLSRYNELEQWIRVEETLRTLSHEIAVDAAQTQPETPHDFKADLLACLIEDLFPAGK